MKQLLFLLLFPCLCVAQYTGNAGQKITLGEQTTADGLVYRGLAADTTRKPSVDTMAYILLDTNTNIIWQYKKATNNAWTRVGGSISSGVTGVLPMANGGTGSASQNFVDLTTTQSIAGAKTFSGNVTINNLNPSGLLKYGAAISSPESGWNELTGIWAMGGTFPNARFYASTSGGTYGYTSFQARNESSGTPLEFFSSYNLFQSPTGIGFIRTGDTTAWLTLANGTASLPPLKLKSGTNVSSPTSGNIEFNGTNLFFTPSTTRHTVNHGLTGSATLNFPSTSTNISADLTITVTGAADGDVVSLGVPNAAVNANTSYSAWVSAANTVTVRFNNYSSGTVDPASASFKVFVTK